MASWHLFNQGWVSRFVLRTLGAFSVNREGLDRQAIEEAIHILQHNERPLVIFPEGTTSRTNDKLMALMDGPAFIARTAAKRRAKENKKVVVHPIGIKYVFLGDLERTCDQVLSRLERILTWRPLHGMPLIDRIIQVGDAMLTLKELEYGIRRHDGSLRERQTRLVQRLLSPLEREWLGREQHEGIAVRIKNLRMKIFPELSRNKLSANERQRRWSHLEDTYLAQQVDCYPENYITEHPSIDRILETVEKFEEDLTDTCTIHGHLKAIIDIDTPIEVSTERDRRSSDDPLMSQIQIRLESKLRELQFESQLFDALNGT
jgi:1-acyl-sn-glycerol-3-phosphate acyltransferase